MRKGFTLLELLTVVIIVAILAAIAVPQFFKVAERARAAEGANILGAIRSAQLRYYAENGKLTNILSQLDVDIASDTIKFFNIVNALNPTYDPTPAGGVQDENIAEVIRDLNASNPGFGTYKLVIENDGDINCAPNGGKCPTGYSLD